MQSGSCKVDVHVLASLTKPRRTGRRTQRHDYSSVNEEGFVNSDITSEMTDKTGCQDEIVDLDDTNTGEMAAVGEASEGSSSDPFRDMSDDVIDGKLAEVTR